jgi:hypothetical protein
MSYGLSNEVLSDYRRTESSTLMDSHFETHLYLHSNNTIYMWNQVNCTQNYYANIGTSAPYNQWSYPMVSCPHHRLPYSSLSFPCSLPQRSSHSTALLRPPAGTDGTRPTRCRPALHGTWRCSIHPSLSSSLLLRPPLLPHAPATLLPPPSTGDEDDGGSSNEVGRSFSGSEPSSSSGSEPSSSSAEGRGGC